MQAGTKHFSLPVPPLVPDCMPKGAPLFSVCAVRIEGSQDYPCRGGDW